MALYRYSSFIQQSNDEAFDTTYSPGTAAPHSGIYRCESCHDEVACNAGNPLPPQNHKQHDPDKGAIKWRLTVYPVQQK